MSTEFQYKLEFNNQLVSQVAEMSNNNQIATDDPLEPGAISDWKILTTSRTSDITKIEDLTGWHYNMPNQCWNGYRSDTQYNDLVSKDADRKLPSNLQYQYYGSSIALHACGICSCISASYIVSGKILTMNDMLNKNAFKWNHHTNSKGVEDGVTLAKWSNTPGVKKTNNWNYHFDDDRHYVWCKNNSHYTKFTDGDPNMFYVPQIGSGLHYSDQNRQRYAWDKFMNQDGGITLTNEYKRCQAKAFSLLKQSIDDNIPLIIYFSGPEHNSGHYVLCIGYKQINNHIGSGIPTAIDEILVADPCPKGYKKNNYYGVVQTLKKSLDRCSDDCSTGIRNMLQMKG